MNRIVREAPFFYVSYLGGIGTATIVEGPLGELLRLPLERLTAHVGAKEFD